MIVSVGMAVVGGPGDRTGGSAGRRTGMRFAKGAGDDTADRSCASPALGAAAEALIHLRGRAGASLAGIQTGPDLAVGEDVTRTDNHVGSDRLSRLDQGLLSQGYCLEATFIRGLNPSNSRQSPVV